MNKDPIDLFGPGGAGENAGPKKVRTVKAKKLNTGNVGDIFKRFSLLGSKRFKTILVFLALVGVCYSMLLVYVEPNEYGIKEVKLGGTRGLHKEVYEAGYHLVVPGMHIMHTLPRDVQVLELTDSQQTAALGARITDVAHIQTSDGFFVDVDVSILYHIEDPYKVIKTIGPGSLFETNGIIPKTVPALKETLGDLTTEEFYNSEMRVKKTEAAMANLNHELEPKGLKVDQVLVRYFKYSPEIQKNIEEKKLKDQLVFKNRAEARAASEGAKLKKIIQEGEMLVKVKLTEGEAYIVKRKAEKDLYRREKRAKADLLVKLAEAKNIELRNAALQGKGSDRMVGLEMAKSLEGLETIVLPSDGENGVNPLNLQDTLELFGVRKEGKRSSTRATTNSGQGGAQ